MKETPSHRAPIITNVGNPISPRRSDGVRSKTVLVRCDARSAQPAAPKPLHHARRRISRPLHNTDFDYFGDGLGGLQRCPFDHVECPPGLTPSCRSPSIILLLPSYTESLKL